MSTGTGRDTGKQKRLQPSYFIFISSRTRSLNVFSSALVRKKSNCIFASYIIIFLFIFFQTRYSIRHGYFFLGVFYHTAARLDQQLLCNYYRVIKGSFSLDSSIALPGGDKTLHTICAQLLAQSAHRGSTHTPVPSMTQSYSDPNGPQSLCMPEETAVFEQISYGSNIQ